LVAYILARKASADGFFQNVSEIVGSIKDMELGVSEIATKDSAL
jgi:hypothetical protein